MATTITKNWAASAELVKTDAYGGSDADLAADQEYDYSGDVDLETAGQEGAHVTIEYRGSGRKDNLIVDVFASLDGSKYDTEPFIHKILQNDGTLRQASLIVKDVAHFRLGLKGSNTNDTFDYLITYQRWNHVDT